MNLADALADNAYRRPDHAAVIEGGRVMSHSEFYGAVRRWAAALAGLGVEPGQIVGVNLKDTAEHLIALYAIARVGAAILPMDWRWTDHEKESVAGAFGAQLVISEADDRFGVLDGPWQSVRLDFNWQGKVNR